LDSKRVNFADFQMSSESGSCHLLLPLASLFSLGDPYSHEPAQHSAARARYSAYPSFHVLWIYEATKPSM
jgi:hypothetical protein